MYVMTVDQRNSSNGKDLIPQLQHDTVNNPNITAPLRKFQRTAGDEAQAIFDNPHSLLATALLLSRTGSWHIGIGKGKINQPLPKNAREGSGEAYKNARIAVERAKKASGHIAYEGPGKFAPLIQATLQLVMGIEEDRNNFWQEIGQLHDRGMTQRAIAEQLETHQPSISRALKQGRWHETRQIMKELHLLLEEEV